MELVGRPRLAKTLPKSLPQPAAQARLNAIDVFSLSRGRDCQRNGGCDLGLTRRAVLGGKDK
jgi:hypothetical protein